jgi:hypothetical protein
MDVPLNSIVLNYLQFGLIGPVGDTKWTREIWISSCAYWFPFQFCPVCSFSTFHTRSRTIFNHRSSHGWHCGFIRDSTRRIGTSAVKNIIIHHSCLQMQGDAHVSGIVELVLHQCSLNLRQSFSHSSMVGGESLHSTHLPRPLIPRSNGYRLPFLWFMTKSLSIVTFKLSEFVNSKRHGAFPWFSLGQGGLCFEALSIGIKIRLYLTTWVVTCSAV